MLFLIWSVWALAQSVELVWETDSVFKVPESVYADLSGNILYISNIDGVPDKKDGKGFISKIRLDGSIDKLRWVEGLDAPKGMALYKNMLYVADISRVVAIDTKKGKVVNTFLVDGAQFLNDVTADGQGNIYISDSATGKIHIIKDNKLTLYFEDAQFKRINGLLSVPEGLIVADAGNGKIYLLDKSKKISPFSETAPGADGVVNAGQGTLIISSWGGEVYFVNQDKEATKILDTTENKLNSADIDYNQLSKTLYIPTFFGNKIMAYAFKM